MPISRFLSDLDDLIAEFQSATPTRSGSFDELRMAVARMHEIQRQLDIAYSKLMPAISIAEMEIMHNLVDFSDAESAPDDRFRMEDCCNTGVSEMDNEHRALIGIGNRVYRLSRHERVTAAEIGAALAELTAHATEHFASEERMMDEADFPQRDRHRAVHRKMLAYLGEMSELAALNPLVVAIKLEKFLGSWFVWHMQQEDAELARHCLEQMPKAA